MVVVGQVNGDYKIKNQWLRRYCSTVQQILRRFNSYEVVHVRREENRDVDDLEN